MASIDWRWHFQGRILGTQPVVLGFKAEDVRSEAFFGHLQVRDLVCRREHSCFRCSHSVRAAESASVVSMTVPPSPARARNP